MDEIDILKKIKKAIKYTFIGLTIMALANIALYWDFFEADIVSNIYLINDILFIEKLLGGMILLPEIVAYLYFKLKYKKDKTILNDVTALTREICDEYPPAICSFIYHKRSNAYADYSATLLALEQKGYLKIFKDHIVVTNKKIDQLKQHEQYVLECLKNNQQFDMIQFKNSVAVDAQKMGLVYAKKTFKYLPQIIMYSSFFLMIAINKKINSDILMYIIDIYAVAIVVYYMIAGYINSRTEGYQFKQIKYPLTPKGKKTKEKILGLKTFIRDYSLLNERSIDEKEIWGKYIAYALSLKEGKTIEQFVSENEQYRNIVYQKRRFKMNDIENIYNDLIMEHSMNSYNKKELKCSDMCELGHNPNCGDEIKIEVQLDGNIIKDMAFSGHGCAISQASTSIMIDTLKGKTIEEAREIVQTFINMIKRETTSEEDLKKLEDAIAFRNIAHMPARVKCALLAWHTIEDLLNQKTETTQ